jgi:phosphoserine aminotransferase
MSQPYDRVYNFSAGPCTLPVEVLEEVRDDMLNWKGCGMSVMELSHRGPQYDSIHNETIETFRKLMNVPENYKVLFLQGGASLQNTMIPMNLLGNGSADYVVTGAWGAKSWEAVQRAGSACLIWDGKATNYDRVPDLTKLEFTPGASYFHYTSNETIHGVQFQGDYDLPGTVVCDMSSDILSRPIDVSKYHLIYAGAQKNMGPAGVAVVVIREDLLERTPEKFHPMLDYRLAAKNNSIYNTPPCFAIYVCGLNYKHMLKRGGLEKIKQDNERKAKIVYDALDACADFYEGHAQRDCRSTMNITFRLPSEELTDKFCKEGEAHKLDGMKGHRDVGGIRASIYNAFPEEGCQVFADFIRDFAAKNG